MFAKLVVVDGIDNDPAEPSWLPRGLRHDLLGQFPKGVAILLRGPAGNFQRTLSLLRVGSQQDAALGLDGKHAITSLKPKSIGHVLRQRSADGSTGLSQRDFLRHVLMVAHQCYTAAS